MVVEPDDDTRTAESDIVLPDTVIHGEVVDAEGRPVAGARVSFMVMGTDLETLSDATSGDDGGFEVRGQPPGAYSLQASSGELRSQREIQRVEEGTRPAPARLVVEDLWELEGRVVARGNGVPGAMLLAAPITAQRTLASFSFPKTRTEIDGRFELGLPGASAFARLFVLAPGYTFHVSTVARGSDGSAPVAIDVGQDVVPSGTVVLPRPGEASDSVPLLMIGSEAVDVPMLMMWSRMNGGGDQGGEHLRVPLLPAGPYSYCRVRADEAILLAAGAAAPAAGSCTEGTLVPGGELVLASSE